MISERRYAGGSYAVSPNFNRQGALYFSRGGCVTDVRECHPLPTGASDSISAGATISNQVGGPLSSLPDGAVRIVSSCGNEDVDAAAKSAIRTAVPFGRFPEAYVGSKLDLLFTFGFAPQDPAQKPKAVPVANHIQT
jgi:hypothetical protein